MTKEYDNRRNRPAGFRPLFEEEDSERYKRLGWDPRKTYEENMNSESLFIDDGSLEEPDLEPAPHRRKPSRAVRDLAAEGRGEDTEIAHLAVGELVVPEALQTPEFLAALEQAATAYGIPLDMLKIGNRMNRINPKTGAPEFGGLLGGFGDWVSRTFGMGTANAAETPDFGPVQTGAEQALGQQQPYRYEGPEIEEIKVTGKPSRIPLNVYPHQRAFFDRFDEPVTRLAQQYDLDPEHLLGLFGHESEWGKSKDAIAANNPFGLNLPGSKQLRPFPTIDAGMDYWGKMYGDQLRGIHKTEDFANKLLNLRAGAYNSVDPNYDKKVINNIHTVNVKRPLWKQGR